MIPAVSFMVARLTVWMSDATTALIKSAALDQVIDSLGWNALASFTEHCREVSHGILLDLNAGFRTIFFSEFIVAARIRCGWLRAHSTQLGHWSSSQVRLSR